MSKRSDRAKKRLEVKKETLRKMEITPQQLPQVNGGAGTNGGTYPSGSNMC